MKTLSDADVLAALAPFDREFFDPQQRFKFIGDGALGGKASGLALAQAVLSRRFPHDRFRRLEVSIPSLTVLRTGVFEDFVRRNGLDELDPALDDDAIARAVQRADLPTAILGDLRALVEEVHTPLAIRSSSLLEDALAQPFAGVYQTKMIPNNQPAADERFRRLSEAVKFVYASAFFSGARSYLAAAGLAEKRDSMGVIVQEVVGTRFRDRFYPHVSAVARSWNYYPTGHAAPADGVASLALGLGKTIVEGGVCWTFSPAWPKAPAPFASAADLASGTQSQFWAVNLGRPPEFDPIRETEFLTQATLADAEEDGTLAHIASTFDHAAGQVRMGTGTTGPRVLDFAMLLTLGEPPLNDAVRTLLEIFTDELEAPVEIELAATFDPHRLGFLQVRPMMVTADVIDITEEQLRSGNALVSSHRVLGNGAIDGIRDIVYAKPAAGIRLDTRAIAAELEPIDRELVRSGTPYLLIGFGRWGSSDPSLGIPVTWPQIGGARVIVEAMRPEMNVEPSQGSHFFHNLSAFQVPYFSIPLSGRDSIDWDWLDATQTVTETPHVRHVRTTTPLRIRVDGRSGRGVVLK
jgi:hypothetical protein